MRDNAVAPTPKSSNLNKFIFGGLSGMGASCIVQPLDLIKTRMQVSGVGEARKEYSSSLDCFKKVVANEGILGLYKGIGASLLRQATYTTTRLGVYTGLMDSYKGETNKQPNLLVQLAMGMTAGSCGAFVGTPADVVLIRMTADGRLPPKERRNYHNVANALVRILREEGLVALWRGCIPTIGRAIVVNMAQLVSYSQFKNLLKSSLEFQEGITLHFSASMISGLITTTASMPMDIAKTRIQNMKVVNGVAEYKGTIDVLLKVGRQEGILALWKGFTPYFCRVGPHTVLTFIFLEQINRLHSIYVRGRSGGTSGL